MHSLADKICPIDRAPSPCESTLYCAHFQPKSPRSPSGIPFFKEGPHPGKIFTTKFDSAKITVPESKKPKLLGFVHSQTKSSESQSPNLLPQQQSPTLSSVQNMKIVKNPLLDFKDTKETLKLSKDLSMTFGSPEKIIEISQRENLLQIDSSKKSDSVSIKLRPKKPPQQRAPINLKKDVILVPTMNKKFSQLIDSTPVSPLLHPSEKKRRSFNEPSIGRVSVCQNASFSNQKSPSHSNYSKSFQYSELPDSIVCKSKDLLKSIETSPEKVGFLNREQRKLI